MFIFRLEKTYRIIITYKNVIIQRLILSNKKKKKGPIDVSLLLRVHITVSPINVLIWRVYQKTVMTPLYESI